MDEPRSTRLNRAFWNDRSEAYQSKNARDLDDRLAWGPSLPDEEELRVLGDVRGKDVLDLCCGGGQTSAYLAARGARVVGVDFSRAQLEHARAHAKARGHAIEFHERSVDDLSIFPDATFDVAFSAFAFGFVERIDAVFREAHRVLRPGGLFAFSWASPIFERTVLTKEGMVIVARPYYDRTPVEIVDHEGATVEYLRTYGDWHRALTDAGFVVTDILEPAPLDVESTWSEAYELRRIQMVPGTTIWRARRPA